MKGPEAKGEAPQGVSRLRMDLARRKLKKLNRRYERAVQLYGDKVSAHDVG